MATRLGPVPAGAGLQPPLADVVRAETRRPRRTIALIPALVLVASAVFAGALLWSRVDYVPMWDGRIYADCINDAASRPVRLESYRCANHVSHAYVAILALAQKAAPYSPVPVLLANAVLFALAAAAFWRLLGRLLPDASHTTARALTTAAVLVHPVMLAALVQPGLDFGVLVFSLWLIAAAVEGRPWGIAVAGSLLAFSKEPGLLVYVVVAAFYAWRVTVPEVARWPLARAGLLAAASVLVAYNLEPEHPAIVPAAVAAGLAALMLARPRGASRVEIAVVTRELRRLWPLVIPVGLFAAYAAYRVLSPLLARPAAAAGRPGGANVVWGTDSGRVLADMFLRLDGDPFERSALALIFVVGFLWIPTVIVAVDALLGAVRLGRRQAARVMPGASPDVVAFVLATTAALTWLLTRYETFSNARYYLPLYPLLLVAACCALVRLGAPRWLREVVLAAMALLLAASATRTIDPVSRRLWGTFRFGDHELLHVTSITGECCGYGRDQLAYNLQFTGVAEVQDALYRRIRPSDSTVFVMHDRANLYTVGPLDPRTHRRTLRRVGVVEPSVALATLISKGPVRISNGWTAWYVAFPNMDNGAPLEAIRRRFDVGAPVWGTTRTGYAMAAYPLRER